MEAPEKSIEMMRFQMLDCPAGHESATS